MKTITGMRIFILSVLALAGLAQVSAAERTDKIFIQGNPAGTQTVQTESAGTTRVEYSYNDRGRGDHIIATWRVNAAGVPIEYEGHGNDYMKAPVEERFEMKSDKASWKNRSEQGQQAVTGEAIYLPMNAPPEFLGVLARALLKAPNHKLALLPAGEASLEEAGKVSVASGKGELAQYRLTGLGFSPQSIWLDRTGIRRPPSRRGSRWCRPRRIGDGATANGSQKTDDDWAERIAHELAHTPKGDLVIRNARLFDPRDLSVTPGASVLVRGDRIVRVAPDADLKPSPDAEIIDAQGQLLMPGLWDNHQHFSDVDGALDLANGVTSARDMANDTDSFLQRVARFDDGRELGPRSRKPALSTAPGSTPDRPRCGSTPPSRQSATSIGMPTMATSRSRFIPPSNRSWFRSSPIVRMRAGCG